MVQSVKTKVGFSKVCKLFSCLSISMKDTGLRWQGEGKPDETKPKVLCFAILLLTFLLFLLQVFFVLRTCLKNSADSQNSWPIVSWWYNRVVWFNFNAYTTVPWKGVIKSWQTYRKHVFKTSEGQQSWPLHHGACYWKQVTVLFWKHEITRQWFWFVYCK